MDEPIAQPRLLRRILAKLAWTLLALIVLYSLSYGPAYVLYFRAGGLDDHTLGVPAETLSLRYRVITSAYAPLESIAETTGLDSPLHAYQAWWVITCQPKELYPIQIGHVRFVRDGNGRLHGLPEPSPPDPAPEQPTAPDRTP